ncbi:adenylate cyclase type 9-like [Amphibalanus amphitrite]|nr:adenylate cyclase type 9-like [Amphibalanus amphitrite]XP_043188915.1 adenylate cyclase type 9-like [Amphibalanus amphitrite]
MASGTPSADPERGGRRRAKLSELSSFLPSVTTPLLGGGGERARRLPPLFERAAHSWWEPRFDSDILEGQYRVTTFLRIKRRLQIGVAFALLAAVVWCAYVAVFRDLVLLSLLLVLGALPLLVVFVISETSYLEHHLVGVSAAAAVGLSLLSLLPAVAQLEVFPGGHSVTELPLFTWAVVTVTMVYTMLPLPLYVSALMAGAYSVTLEALTAAGGESSTVAHIAIRAGLHLCLHLIGLRTLVLAQAHMRSTFMTVGQTLLTRQQLELEKQLKEKMIHLVMPPVVAGWAQDRMTDERTLLESSSLGAELARPLTSQTTSPEISFRPFNMQSMDPVSILFADIVGFTRMSSNKSAEQLVGLLNDLFGRFDELCTRHGCEKISTLGDCYYCVSGCPEPRDDHAICCVEMGLSMITAIQEFDEDNCEDVNMRVGVHTGRVLCGLVGTKRFKFDVWSNDVTMANKMESSGRPGAVHVSERTVKYLQGKYVVTPGEPLSGLETFFIGGRRSPVRTERPAEGDGEGEGEEPGSPPSQERRDSSSSLLHKKACSLPSIIEPSGTSKQPGSPELTSTLDRRGRRPRLRTIRTDTDLRGRLCGTTRTRLTSGNFWLHSLPEEQHPPHITELNGTKPGDLPSHRVANFNMSSQSSMLDPSATGVPIPGAGDDTDLLGGDGDRARRVSQQQMQRKLSDLEMIKCVQTITSKANYFIHPPIDRLTLFFDKPEYERLYRMQHARRHHGGSDTLSLPKYNSLVDTLVATAVFVVLTAELYATFEPSVGWAVFSGVAALWLVLIQCMMWLRLTSDVPRDLDKMPTRFELVYTWYTRWYPFHAVGASLVSLPVAAVFANWSCDAFESDCSHADLYFLMFLVGLVHFCNFTQLNCWMKSGLATLFAAAMAALLCGVPCDCPMEPVGPAEPDGETGAEAEVERRRLVFSASFIVGMVVVVVLIWILNREFEISYRLGFCVSLTAAHDKAEVQRLEGQADWLLHQIIPSHVAEIIKEQAKYSENHRDVAVVFASIVNFNDLYDETYHDGREYMRVLNEIISDMDDLLKKYTSVEKIKTIGSTYMAASGLNSSQRNEAQRPDQHLVELMEFAIDLQRTVAAFNETLFGFTMELRIGYNIGDVTSGVIGTTKLYFDIWGDTVNIASRMDSTGVTGRIQTTQACAQLLEPYFEFERRGEVFVKGKDNMVTYFLVGKRDSAPAVSNTVS